MLVEAQNFFNLKSTLVQYAVILGLFLLVSVVELALTDPSIQRLLILNFLSIYIPSLILFTISTRILNFRGTNYFNYSITTIILYLLIHPTTVWWLFPIVIILAAAAKYMFRYKQLPIFNPAAMGLFLTYWLTVLLQKLGVIHETLFVSWWGAELNRSSYSKFPVFYIIPVIFAILFLYYARRYRKLIHGSVFLISYLTITSIFVLITGKTVNTVLELIVFTLMSSYAFLSFVMVTEPKTSPVLPKQQIALGILGAVFLFIFANYLPYIKIPLEIPDITALLVLNIFTVVFKSRKILAAA